MGYKCSLAVLSNGIPREDITTSDERGPEAAAQFVERLWPGQFSSTPQHTSFDECANPHDESIAVGTWGDTVVVAAMDPESVIERAQAAGDPRGAWMVVIHSVVDLCVYRTPAAYGQRQVVVSSENSPEELAEALAAPKLLPFEEPFARGEHRDGDEEHPLPYHPLTLGDAAVAWILGTFGEGPEPDEVMDVLELVDPWDLPMHHFELLPRRVAKPGLFKRIFGSG